MPKQILNYQIYFEDDAYVCKVEALYHVDGYYGADADGNGGYPKLFIDDVHILEISLNGSRLPVPNAPDALKEKILASVDEHI